MQETDCLGKKLKALRHEKNISQIDVAEYLNVTRQNYSSYETKGTMPPIDTLRKLAVYFDVSSDYLIGLSDQRNPSTSNISGSNFVQGSGSVMVGEILSDDESELIHIFRDIGSRGRLKLLGLAFELEDEKLLEKEGSNDKH